MQPLALSAAAFGLTGVALGAGGAHALKPLLLERDMLGSWQTAVLYQLVHALALLAIAVWSESSADTSDRRWLSRAGLCWTAGILLFSGSIYGLALEGPRLLGPVTPIGGLALMAGWGCLAVHAAKGRASKG